jgi:hypothetical protein
MGGDRTATKAEQAAKELRAIRLERLRCDLKPESVDWDAFERTLTAEHLAIWEALRDAP